MISLKHPLSLNLRLTLMIALAATVVFSSFGWLLLRSINMHFAEMDREEMTEVLQLVESALHRHGGHIPSMTMPFQHILSAHHASSISIFSDRLDLLFSSQPTSSAVIDNFNINGALLPGERTWIYNEQHYRGTLKQLTTHGSTHSVWLLVAVSMQGHQRFLESFHLSLWYMVGSGILIMGMMGGIAVRQGHRPLRQITQKIEEISADHLHTRLQPEDAPDELQGLVNAFNQMLERVEGAFHRLSNYSADIAHEMRTPITKLKTQTEVALTGEHDPQSYREVLYSSLEEYEQLASMISDMLFLAKSENGLMQLNRQPFSLAEEVQNIFDYYEAWAEDEAIELRCQGDANINADRGLIRRVLSNLISNAIRYSNSGAWIDIDIKGSSHVISIDISNPGEIDSEQLPRIFDRFYRLENRAHRGVDEGAGLGLAIVKSIIQIHGGEISVQSRDEKTHFLISLKREKHQHQNIP